MAAFFLFFALPRGFVYFIAAKAWQTILINRLIKQLFL